jgi:AcrR family transcriptional regulator
MDAIAEPKRRRDAVATRAGILEAAKVAFTQHGYDGVGVRDIAARAGVDPALINRYFGHKQTLFAEVMAGALDLAPFLTKDRAGFGRRLAEAFVTTRFKPDAFRPMLVMMRSAASPEAAAVLRQILDEGLAKPLAVWRGGADAEARAGLILAQLTGFFTLRTVLGVNSLGQASDEALVRQLAPAVQRYVDQDAGTAG